MPREIVRKIHTDAVSVIQRPDFLERVAKDGIEPVATSTEAFGAQIKAEIERYRPIVQAAGVKPE